MNALLHELADTLVLSALMEKLREYFTTFELLDEWRQGEFHHDVLFRVPLARDGGPTLPGPILVVATNCNGGVKEVLSFAEPPDRDALWHARCPASREFSGELGRVLGEARTLHWFDPCELLADDARSELRPEFRTRQRGGGFEPTYSACGKRRE